LNSRSTSIKKESIKSEDPKQKAIVRKKSAGGEMQWTRVRAIRRWTSYGKVIAIGEGQRKKRKRRESKRKWKERQKGEKRGGRDADAIEGDQVQKLLRIKLQFRRSSPGSHHEEEEETTGAQTKEGAGRV